MQESRFSNKTGLLSPLFSQKIEVIENLVRWLSNGHGLQVLCHVLQRERLANFELWLCGCDKSGDASMCQHLIQHLARTNTLLRTRSCIHPMFFTCEIIFHVRDFAPMLHPHHTKPKIDEMKTGQQLEWGARLECLLMLIDAEAGQ